MSAREKRLLDNQERFRRANERLRDSVERAVDGGQTVAFLCECPDEDCTARIELTLDEYREVRSHPDGYAVGRDHPTMPHETVLDDRGRYMLVQKGSDG